MEYAFVSGGILRAFTVVIIAGFLVLTVRLCDISVEALAAAGALLVPLGIQAVSVYLHRDGYLGINVTLHWFPQLFQRL